MLKRDWVTYAAFGGLVLAVIIGASSWGYSAWRPYHQANDKSRAEAAKYDTGGASKSLKMRCEIVESRLIDCESEQPDSEGANYHTKADLKAQQDTAEWTFLGVILNVVGLGLTTIATGGLLYSLYLNRSATKAAIQAVAIARDLGYKQTRAYLGIYSVHMEDFVVGRRPLCTVVLRNNGQTPAFVIKSYIDIFHVDSLDAINIVFRHGRDKSEYCVYNGNDSSRFATYEELTQEMLDLTISGRKKWIVFG